ncbi:MAG: winged helix-turn-helix transcriptional regulator [Thermoplasmatales archaeon]|nr:winged helix-turn-helix transcriptional regulator [Thermoplasmatales archaeon]
MIKNISKEILIRKSLQYMQNIHKLLGQKYVRLILEELEKDDKSFSEIAYNVVKNTAMANNTLKKLLAENFVKKNNKGRKTIYSITEKGKELLNYIRVGDKFE